MQKDVWDTLASGLWWRC